MRRYKPLLVGPLLAALAVAGLTAPAADAAPRAKAAKPKITRVTPMRVEVGDQLTIRGRNFKARKHRNTVIFKGAGGRTAFAKPRRASKGKLVVKIPGSVSRLLALRDGQQRPTRIKLRVLAGKFSAFTPRRLSPVVVGEGGSGAKGPGKAAPRPPCSIASERDDDGDLLSNRRELEIGTDPCLLDTDRDGIEDGYEHQSAIDLNHYPVSEPLHYPGKRPYPNALDPSDKLTDYDGDGLALIHEFLLWHRYSADGVPRQSQPSTLDCLLYSDGLQDSRYPRPGVTCSTIPEALGLTEWALHVDEDGVRNTDDERDGDGDGLSNWDEAVGRFTESWWAANHDGTYQPLESVYPDIDFLDDEDLVDGEGVRTYDALADHDVDGDDVLDGDDDHDHDGLSNQFEVRRPATWFDQAIVGFPIDNPWAYVHPFNPCKPFDSARCHRHEPLGYYDGDGVPWKGPPPPAGYPDERPETPNGY